MKKSSLQFVAEYKLRHQPHSSGGGVCCTNHIVQQHTGGASVSVKELLLDTLQKLDNEIHGFGTIKPSKGN